jgi:hypothetical protein
MDLVKNITIISGGQTGVDRAALDFALNNGINCGGWCPSGRKAEDGKIPEKYPMIETSSNDYAVRTRKNVEESDGTLIIYDQNFDQGTGLTLNLCKKHNKPWLVIRLSGKNEKDRIHQWLKNNNIKILNIAGPRESIEKGIYIKTIKLLEIIFH